MKRTPRVEWSAILLLCMACDGSQADVQTPGSGSAPWFESVAGEVGVDFVHGFGPLRYWMPERGRGGLGLFDMDKDGDLDLYVLQGADLEGGDFDGRNRLYENDGQGVFTDVTEAAGVGDPGFGYGCAVGDYNRDGLLDLYVVNVGPNVLYRNLGDGRFEDVTETAGAAGTSWGTSATFLDYDEDGHLDVYISNYIEWSPLVEIACRIARGAQTYCSPNRYKAPAVDTLLRNRGDGTFEDVSREVGLDQAYGNGFGVVWGRLDERPGLDLFVANDGMANQFWSTSKTGRFEERSLRLGCALSSSGATEAGMGVCLGDIDGDQEWDLVLTHLAGETNTFYMGTRTGFRDRTSKTGTHGSSMAMTGFGVGLADFDHDGLDDLYVANGRVTLQDTSLRDDQPLSEPDQLFRGLGSGRFEAIPAASISIPGAVTVSRGAAFGDIDNDGDVDVCVSDYCEPVRILRNVVPKRGKASTWSILEGDGLPAVGAELRFELAGRPILKQVQRAYSYCATNDPRVHVGFGDVPQVDAVEVTWLDGSKETFGPLQAGERAILSRGEGRSKGK